MPDIDVYLSGDALYGDDLDPSQVAQWQADEQEAYAELGAKNRSEYTYAYHAWNSFHGFRHLPSNKPFNSVLGYGDEFQPIASRIRSITIVDPSDAFKQESVLGIPARYVSPAPDGRIPLADRAFDLITAFGVLHHVPNVSFVVGELARTLGPEGYLLVREPIVSMGDWRKPRPHLTKHERGIPLKILQSIVRNSGLDIVRIGLCGFPPAIRAFAALRVHAFNSRLATSIDAVASNMMSWNINYHARSFIQKLRPTSAFLIARKS